MRDIKDFCFDVFGKMSGGSCFVELEKDKCDKLGGTYVIKNTLQTCKFSDISRWQERTTAIKLSNPLNSRERLILIKSELQQGLPAEMKQFDEDLADITDGLNVYGIKAVMEELREGFKPIEEKAKRLGLREEAVAIAEGLLRGTKQIMAGFSKEDKDKVLLPAIDEAKNQLSFNKNMKERIKQLVQFEPDENNKEVWLALIKYPEALEVWGENPKPYPEGIRSIKLYRKYDREELWKIIDNKGDGAFITYYPNKQEVEMNSPAGEYD